MVKGEKVLVNILICNYVQHNSDGLSLFNLLANMAVFLVSFSKFWDNVAKEFSSLLDR